MKKTTHQVKSFQTQLLVAKSKKKYSKKNQSHYFSISEILRIERQLALEANNHLYLHNAASAEDYVSIHNMKISYNPHSFRLVSN